MPPDLWRGVTINHSRIRREEIQVRLGALLMTHVASSVKEIFESDEEAEGALN